MRIIHLVTSSEGGAGLAALRLCEAINQTTEHTADVLHLYGESHHDSLIQYQAPKSLRVSIRNKIKHFSYKNRFGLPSLFRYVPHVKKGFEIHTIAESAFPNLQQHPKIAEADIVHLHFVSKLVDIPTFLGACQKPVVWTLHDMNGFTGTCHYSFDCQEYMKACAQCPQLEDGHKKICSHTWQLKEKAYAQKGLRLGVVTPSEWLARVAGTSTLMGRFAPMAISNCIDLEYFCPVADNTNIRQALGMEPGKATLLFVSEDVNNYRKGFSLLKEALEHLPKDLPIQLLVIGKKPENMALPFPVTYLGYLKGHEIVRAYQAADLLVVPSRYDNLPNTVLEAYACGTPVMAFDTCGLTELVSPIDPALLCPPFEATKMAEMIAHTLTDGAKLNELAKKARKYAESNFSYQRIAGLHVDLYHKLSRG